MIVFKKKKRSCLNTFVSQLRPSQPSLQSHLIVRFLKILCDDEKDVGKKSRAIIVVVVVMISKLFFVAMVPHIMGSNIVTRVAVTSGLGVPSMLS